MKCPKCGQETNDVVCSCGYRFEEQTAPQPSLPPKRFCANCGAEVTGKFCAKCGTPTVNQTNPAPNTARPAVNRIPPVANTSATAVNSSNNSLAMAGMILSIIGFLLSAAPGLIIVSIIGLVLSIKGRNSEKKKMATAGIVLGILGILMGFYFLGSSSDADKGSSSSSSSSSVSSRSSSISSSKISSSSASPAAQPLEVKEPTTSYKELSFYIPESWEYKEINDMPYYYFDDVHFLFIQSVDNPKDAKFSLSQMKNEVVSGFESTGNSKKTRDLDTSKYNMEMSGFAGESKLENGTLLTSSYVLQSTDYVYVFNFAGTTEDDTFDSEKDLILNSIVDSNGSDQGVPVSKSVEISKEESSSTQPSVKTTGATISQKNALKKAQDYLSYSAFSYEGLIHQLEYEKFSHEDAVYGADNCNADWKEQALKKARDYLGYSAFSYDGLIHQLEYEKFTTEQATYGADNCGADWNEQAEKKAKDYLNYSSFSKESLISQLEFEGFTHAQAVHGAEANGY